MNRTLSFLAGITLLGTGIYLFRKETKQKTTPTMPNNNSIPTTSPYYGDINAPMGYRNNNPLNIRHYARNSWMGQILPNSEGAFEKFVAIEYGYRAALLLIRNYTKEGYRTISQIINRWAPKADNNDPERYIATVCQITGFMPGTIINAYSQDDMCNLVYAMAVVENGTKILPNTDQIINGYKLL